MVSFAENLIDCRRRLQLLHLGEQFNREVCIRNKLTTCDNCENVNKHKEEDVTKQARELSILVKDLAVKGNVTMLHIVDVYKGAKIKKIIEKRHNTHKYYGSGSALDRTVIHRIMKDLVLKNYLADHVIYTGQFPLVYIKPGPLFSQLGQADFKMKIAMGTENIKNMAGKSVTSNQSIKISIDQESPIDSSGNDSSISKAPSTSTAATAAKKASVTKFNKKQIEQLKVCTFLCIYIY